MGVPAAPELPGVLGTWSFEPLTVAVLASVGVAYGWGCRVARRLSPRHPVPRGQRSAFAGGLVVVSVALLSPVDTYADVLLSVHMAQHVLLTLVAAPLLLLGHPGTLALRVVSPQRRRRWLRIGRGRTWRLVSSPVLAWGLFAATGWAIHFSPLFDAALRSRPVHVAEHALFLGTALLFWWPVVGGQPGRRPLPHPVRLLYLGVAMPQNTFLALAVFGADEVLYSRYAELARAWGPTPLSDQRQGAGLMWVAGDLILLVSVLLVAAAWARHEGREAERAERAAPESAPATG
ncbi:MAG TPA: cytochrome c oxidase assembly protein [Acidimicrobiales bacterium]|nr:cytochrome c oxidase assembly protein [Acidimicrobiales bacterium]